MIGIRKTEQGKARAARRMAMLAVLAGILAATPAAAQRCTGTYAATALRPLPPPVIVALDIRDPSPENQRLGQRFMQGVRDAGAKVDGTATAGISVFYSVLGLDTDRLSGGGERSFADFGNFSGGGLNPSTPSEARMRVIPPRHPHSPATLALRAEVTHRGSTQVDWVLSLQCQMTEQEPMELAYEIGRLIGGALGRTVPRQAF